MNLRKQCMCWAMITVVVVLPVWVLAGESLTLEKCVSLALENNPQIFVHVHKVQQREIAFDTAKTVGYGDIGLSLGYARLPYVSQMKQRFLGNLPDDFTARVGVRQPLYLGGRNVAAREEARYAWQSAENTAREVDNDVVYRVTVEYYKYMYYNSVARIKRELLERYRSYLLFAADSHDRTGMPRKETVLRIKALVKNAEAEVEAAHQNVVAVRENLSFIMGVDIHPDWVFMDVAYSTPAFVLNNLVQVAMKQRPALKALESEIGRARASMQSVRSVLFPHLYAYASYGYEWSQFPPRQDDWVAGIQMEYALWNWGRTKARERQMESFINELSAHKRMAEMQLRADLSVAVSGYLAAHRRKELAYSGLQFAEEALQSIEHRFRMITASNAELMDVGHAYVQARINVEQALLDVRLAAAEIARITGACK